MKSLGSENNCVSLILSIIRNPVYPIAEDITLVLRIDCYQHREHGLATSCLSSLSLFFSPFYLKFKESKHDKEKQH